MPPASFEMLVTTLATEALVALGQIPHPATNKAEVHRGQAQYMIDTLDVLREKTGRQFRKDDGHGSGKRRKVDLDGDDEDMMMEDD